MSAYPPPTDLTPVFNTSQFQSANSSSLDIAYLNAHYLQFPIGQGNITVPSAIVDNGLTIGASIVMEPNANPPTNYLEFPDGTQQFTASTGGNPTNLLSSSNIWTGSQTWNGSPNNLATGATTLAPAETDNGKRVPTTAWVNTAISTALENITPAVVTSINKNFDGSVQSFSYTIPADADNFNITIQGVGGYAGSFATSVPIITPNTTDFTLYSGGQGGGAIGNQCGSNQNVDCGLAGQVLTIGCSGNGTNTNVYMNWTNSQTGLPVVVSVLNGGNGGNATSTSPGTAGAGALTTGNILPFLGTAWMGYNAPQAYSGSPGTSFVFNSSTNSTDVPYAGLNPAYTTTQTAGAPFNQTSGGFLPFAGTGSGTEGYGQIYPAFHTASDIIYQNGNDTFYGFSASPIGLGFVTVTWSVGNPKQLGGTNSSFIAYDDPSTANKTKQIYTDKEGLVVSQELNTTPKTTTLTPTNLTQDINGVVSTALIADIITSANTDDTLQEVLNAGDTAINADLILLTSANNNQIKLNGTSTNGIQITNPSAGSYPYCVMGISGFSQGANATNTLQASNNLVRVYNNSLGNPAETSIRSGVSNLNESNITAQSNSVGYTTTPTIQVFNTNTTAGNTTGVPSIEFYKRGRNVVQNDVIATQSFNALNYLGTKTTFGKIECVATNSSAGSSDDGAMDFYSCVNGTSSLVMRLNGADNENNSFRPLDMNGNNIRTATGDMTITSVGSSGTGNIAVSAKGSLTLSSSPANNIILNNQTTLAVDKQIIMSKSGANVYQGTLGADLLQVSNLTANLYTNVIDSGLVVNDANPTLQPPTYFTKSGFYNSDNSIYCNSANGFVLNYGSSVNRTDLDLTKLQLYNTGVSNQDTILLQNTGSANPVLNLQTSNTSTNIQYAMGASPTGMGVSATNNVSFQSKQVAINNVIGSPSIIQHYDQIDSLPFTVATPVSLELSIGSDFILTGSNIESGSAGGSSGQYLRIKINGTYYKIALLND